MDQSEQCTCCTCGFQWERGKSGSHSCADTLRTLLGAYRAALYDEWSCLTPPESAPCQASLMSIGDRCRCAKCRRKRFLELDAKAEALSILC